MFRFPYKKIALLESIVILSILTVTSVSAGLLLKLPILPLRFFTSDPILEVHSDSLTSYKNTSATAIQALRPQYNHRGVRLDGTVKNGPFFRMAIAGNEFESTVISDREQKVDLVTGGANLSEVDIALPAAGFSWIVGRSYNSTQKNSGSAYNSNGYAGYNWMQTSQMEIAFYNDADDTKDLIYLYYSAGGFLEFARYPESTTTFKATNGANGVIRFVAGVESEPDTYLYHDAHGMTYTFFGSTNASTAAWQLWKISDPAGNVAFVGDATTGSTAISGGFTSGKIQYAYDTSDRRYTYTYSTVGGATRLTQVKSEIKSSGSWSAPSGVATVAQVDYTYYSSDGDSHGDNGDLKMVKTTTPLTDSGINSIRKTYYRYWDADVAYHATTNPGYPHEIKMIVAPEGTRQHDWQDVSFDEDFLTESDANLKSYADAYFEYDTNYKIKKFWFNGACGCGGAGTGDHVITYESNGSFTPGAGYTTGWATRTIVTEPSTRWTTVLFDEVGQTLTRVHTDIDPAEDDPVPSQWVLHTPRGSDGLVTDVHTPANVTAYTHSTGAVTLSSSVGLVHSFTRIGSNETKGYVSDRKWKEGTSGTAYLDGSVTYALQTVKPTTPLSYDVGVTRVTLASSRAYTTEVTSGTSGSNLTSFTTTHYVSSPVAMKDLAIEKITTTLPAVGTGNNGENATHDAKK
ncbi:MAG: hypothetical protein ACKVS6_15625, partial [Planctomycetota bacterium]